MSQLQAAVPRRPCGQPDPAAGPDRGARGGRERRRSRQRSQRIQEQAIRDVVAMQEDIGLQARHRRRIQPRRLASRLPAALRECAADPVEDHGALPLRRGHARPGAALLAGRRQARAAEADLRRGFPLPRVDRARDAEDHDSVADHHALPRRARGDRPGRLSGHGRLLCRSRARLRARRSPISRRPAAVISRSTR